MVWISLWVANRRVVDVLHTQQGVGLDPSPVRFDLRLSFFPQRFKDGWDGQQIGKFLPLGRFLPLPRELVELARSLRLPAKVLRQRSVQTLFVGFGRQVGVPDCLAQVVMREGEQATRLTRASLAARYRGVQ